MEYAEVISTAVMVGLAKMVVLVQAAAMVSMGFLVEMRNLFHLTSLTGLRRAIPSLLVAVMVATEAMVEMEV